MIKSRLLLNARRAVLKSRVISSIVVPFVDYYRQGIFHFGPDTHELSLSTGESAVFKTETIEEIRHFYPFYGEVTQLEDLIKELEEEDVFFDVGAHIGIYSIISGKIIDPGQIFAFEPHPTNVERMKENIKLNNINIEGVNIFGIALSDENKSGELYVDSKSPGAIGHITERREEAYEIEYREGNKVLEKEDIPGPNILKIDVEGAELRVLKGLENHLRDCRVCYVEVSEDLSDFGDSRQDLFDFFEKRGFQKRVLTQAHERGNYKFYRK